jgi:phage portal protein BeeE
MASRPRSSSGTTVILHAALRGVGYAEIVPGPRGAVDQLISLHTDRVVTGVAARRHACGSRSRPAHGRTGSCFRRMFRIPGFRATASPALRAVDIAADAIGLGMAADNYASRIFSNNLNMGGFLSSQKKMSPEAQRRLITKLMENVRRRQQFGRPMILQDGIKYEKASMLASEAQLLEARKWQMLESRGSGVSRRTCSASTTDQPVDRRRAVDQLRQIHDRPWARRIEQAVRRDLIIAKGAYEVKLRLRRPGEGQPAGPCELSQRRSAPAATAMADAERGRIGKAGIAATSRGLTCCRKARILAVQQRARTNSRNPRHW